MKTAIIIIALAVILTLFLVILPNSNKVTALNNLPNSLEQWYKPVSKRNLWQHNMFKLRRELQAISTYAAEGNWELTQKWASSFDLHYRKIAEMIPQWQDEINLKTSEALVQASKENSMHKLNGTIRDLRRDCRQCHETYRGVVALRYRAPDFSELKVSDSQGESYRYRKFMKLLMRDLNAVVIANTDQQYDKALKSLSELEGRMADLGKSCISCHKTSPEAREYYLGAKTRSMVDTLRLSLIDEDTNKIGHNIGSLAVQACAKCHGSHRIASDMRVQLK